MDPFDPYYTGLIPNYWAILVGVLLVVIMGWLYSRGEKK